MAFDQTSIVDVRVGPRGADVEIAWTSTLPEGTVFHVYIDRHRAYSGTARSCVVPSRRNMWIDVGAVLPSEARADLSATLPPAPGTGARAVLTWVGGTFEAPDLQGFHVYRGPSPGAPVSYAAPAATVAAYSPNAITDGFGIGGFGEAGFGAAAASYRWVSDPLTNGVWNFAVVPFDLAGNDGTPTLLSVTIVGPPGPPARDSLGNRLEYTYASGFGQGGFGEGGFGGGPNQGSVTLTWLASPG